MEGGGWEGQGRERERGRGVGRGGGGREKGEGGGERRCTVLQQYRPYLTTANSPHTALEGDKAMRRS